MIPQTVKNIIEEFDELLKIHANDEDVSKLIAEDVKFINLWREELESEKQSIFIIGKTSTGKSEFHNFLLDLNNKEDVIFKTSTKVETGIIQTLRHCENGTTPCVEIIVKNRNEFNKLIIPPNINYELNERSCKILLNNTDRICFFRDNVIAKSDNSSNFNLMAAVTQVNIKYPLKYFRKYRIIDTPGLASSISGTDSIVKDYFHGKSHIFWFLDASTRTMPDNLKLLDKEKDLIKMSYDRINFIANKFDLMEYDDDNNSKDEVLKRKEELTSLLKKTLVDVIGIEDINPKITFTSFRHPKEKFGEHDTFHGIKSIEESLIMDEKGSNYNNIFSLISKMKEILKKLIEKVISQEKKEIDSKLLKLDFDQNKIKKSKEILYKQIAETINIIKDAKENIRSIKKEKNLNTHDRYNKYVELFKTEINKSCKKIENSVRRMNGLELTEFYDKLNQIRSLKIPTLENNEGWFEKIFYDKELNTKKEEIKEYVTKKLNEFDLLPVILNKAVENKRDNLNCIETEICNLKVKKDNIESNSNIISKIREKINNIDNYLLEDIENRVNQWVPSKSNENETLLSFMNLYSLLKEHKMIKEKI